MRIDELGTVRSLDQLVTATNSKAELCTRELTRWGEDSAPVRALLDHGLPPRDQWGDPFEERELHYFSNWKMAAGPIEDGVLMDTTTLYLFSQLVGEADDELLTPLSLWDLSEVATNIVMENRIYHIEADWVDDDKLNGILGLDVFHTIPDPPPQLDLVVDTAERTQEFIGQLRQLASGGQGILADEASAVAKSWSVMLGRDIPPTEPFDLPFAVHGGGVLGAEVWFGDDSSYVSELTRSEMGNYRPSGPIVAVTTYRAYINVAIACLLDMRYAPATARMPFAGFLRRRGAEIERYLRRPPLVDELNAAYASLEGQMRLVLPVFLAVALNGVTEPADIGARLAGMRLESERFRNRLHQLNDKLTETRSDRETMDLIEAIQSDAFHLSQAFRLQRMKRRSEIQAKIPVPA